MQHDGSWLQIFVEGILNLLLLLLLLWFLWELDFKLMPLVVSYLAKQMK